MRQQFYPPKRGEAKFHCLRCGVYAQQSWRKVFRSGDGRLVETEFLASECAHCDQYCYWFGETMVVPPGSSAPMPHPELPHECASEYGEARAVVDQSPRAAAALLRLAVQKLMPLLGESGDNINADIKALVAKGLPVEVQQALDYCRVVGNHAVHPGEIVLNDTPEIALQLFDMLNFIVEDRIARPAAVRRMYESLPQASRDAIAMRDGSGSQGAPK